MQPLFTSLSEWNERLCRETYYKSTLTVYPAMWAELVCQIIVMIVTLGFGATYFVLGFYYDLSERLNLLIVLDLALGVFLLYQLLSRPKKTAAREVQMVAKKYGTVRALTQDEFFEDFVYHRSLLHDTVYVVDYRDLLCVKQTKHYIMMFTRAQGVWAVEKSGVENGASEALYCFLRAKSEARKEEA